MAVYVILSLEANSALEERIVALFPEDNYKLSDRQWLVSSNKIAKAISDDLGASDGKYGQLMVFWAVGYFGWWSKTVWDWLKLKEQN